MVLTVERLAKSGDGVAHLGGRTVFVPGALPGERVMAQVEESGRALRAAGHERLESSPARRPPPCALADRCGGCDWLHAQEALQRAEKVEIAASALEHLGGVERGRYQTLPLQHPGPDLGYRRRAVLHPAHGGLGFFGRRSHDRVRVERCPALVPALEALPGALVPALLPVLGDLVEVTLLAEGGRRSVALELKGGLRDRHRKAAEALVAGHGVQGVVLRPPGVPPELVGDPVLEEGSGVLLRADAFAQANGPANERLVEAALAGLEPAPGDRALELYCGNGNFTLRLAPKVASVLAVESSPEALDLARRGVAAKGLGNARFVQGDAEKVARGLISEGQGFDLLLLDPPRAGAPDVGAWAAALRPRRVAYVACDVGALARDAGALMRAGFWPRTLQLFDLFPQTRHVEALMLFARDGA